MAILLDCPNCQKKLRLPDEARGVQAQCPHCEAIFDVSAPAPPPLDPNAVITVQEAGADEGAAIGIQGRICPVCNADLPREAVLCVRCGFDFRSGKKLNAVNADRKARSGTLTSSGTAISRS
jgi:ribosomal protein L40E